MFKIMQLRYWRCKAESDPGDKLMSNFHLKNLRNEINWFDLLHHEYVEDRRHFFFILSATHIALHNIGA